MELSSETRRKILGFQETEITEHHIYSRLAALVPEAENRSLLQRIAGDELRHYEEWKGLTQQEARPKRLLVLFYVLVSRLFGYTFGLKLMERGEGDAQEGYGQVAGEVKLAEQLMKEEEIHEQALLRLLDEERLRYAGSIVLGLNDALVELTGALAGLTLALQNTRLIAMAGLVTGVAAAMSMAASEYLSTRSEATGRNPIRASIYTGVAYIFTVALLILPYLLVGNYFLCLALALLVAVLIIAGFNFYISVAKEEPFRRRFLEMAGLSFGVALLSFLFGYLVRTVLGIEV